MKRRNRLSGLRKAINGRGVAWFGTRGSDAVPLARAGLLNVICSQVDPLAHDLGADGPSEDCLETRLEIREDLNVYDIDRDTRSEAVSLREGLLSRGAGEVVDGWLLAAYRPAEFLAAVNYTRPGMIPCHMFYAAQRVFEHKPWVETEMESVFQAWEDRREPAEGRCAQTPASTCPRTLGWTYVRDTEEYRVLHALEKYGRIVVRTNYTDGGVGVALVESGAALAHTIPGHREGFYAYSPYYDGALPLNINAVIYPNGEVRAFHISTQLIGIDACTRRRFGFCGSDFARAAELDDAIVERARLLTELVGQWAGGRGYLGLFGLDMLLYEGELMLTEMNPRFQASTVLSETLAEAQDITGPQLEHIAAHLGMAPPDEDELPSLRDQMSAVAGVRKGTPLSQIICYNDRNTDVRFAELDQCALPDDARVESLPALTTYVKPEAILGKVLAPCSVTEDGYSLREPYRRVRQAFRVIQLGH